MIPSLVSRLSQNLARGVVDDEGAEGATEDADVHVAQLDTALHVEVVTEEAGGGPLLRLRLAEQRGRSNLGRMVQISNLISCHKSVKFRNLNLCR